MNFLLKKYMTPIFGIFISLLAMPVTANVVFTDNTFNLANYTVQTFQSGGATINTSQTLLLGNPGSAVQALYDVPIHSSTFFISQYLINPSFSYNPSTQGAIQTIDILGDGFAEVSSSITANDITMLLSQAGNFYTHSVVFPTVNGAWNTGSQSGLVASDFNLVTDLLTLSTNSGVHPDFNSGNIQFGMFLGAFTTGTAATNWDIRLDNISYTVVNAVPIPPAVWLFGSGLIGLIGVRRKSSILSA